MNTQDQEDRFHRSIAQWLVVFCSIFGIFEAAQAECIGGVGTDDIIISNIVYQPSDVVDCEATGSITLGSDVTISDGAVVELLAPSVIIKKDVNALLGSQLRIRALTNLRLTTQASPIGTRGLIYKGRPVFSVGSGSFWLLNDPYYYAADGATNLVNLRDHLDKYKPIDPDGKALGVIRLSSIGSPVRYSGINHADKRYPCARSSTAGAADGGNKFDCSILDEDFFAHLLTVVREADQRGIIIGIILWDEIPLEGGDKRWEHNPFCPDNNINNYGLPACSSNAVPEFYDASPSLLRDHQDLIVEQYVQVLTNEPNVFFFIGNEYTGDAAWRDRVISIVDNANNANGSKLLHVTMDFGSGESSLSDGVSANTNAPGTGSDSFRGDGRPAIQQRDYRTANADGKRINFWERFMDGAASAGTRDDYSGNTLPDTTYDTAAAEDQQLRAFVNSIHSPLDQLVPNDAVLPTGWTGRANIGNEYIAYNDSSSNTIDFDLGSETGDWRLIEWDANDITQTPVDRGTKSAGTVINWASGFTESAIQIVKVVSGGILFEEDFDNQADWQTLDKDNIGSVPAGWDAGRTDENWHPVNVPESQPSMLISGANTNQVYDGAGKAFITYSESFNDTSNNGFTSDGFITKDITPTDELYVQFRVKFQPGWASNSEGGQIKLFRVLSWDGVGSRNKFFSDGNSAPIYIFDWAQSPTFGVRQFHAFRCDDQENNYFCTNPEIEGAPRNIHNGDMSANFVGDISQFPNTIPDLVNGGTIPTSGTIYHNQIYGDVWHKMSFYLRLNSSPGVKDGILQVWLDDHPITDMEQIPWIGTNGDINAKWNSISFGGNDNYHFQDANSSIWAANKERWYAIDDIKVFASFP